jgi:hypothetical protein
MMRHLYRLAVALVALALAGCGAPDRPAASGDTAQATNSAYPAPPASAAPQATAELTATAALTPTSELTPTSLPIPTAVPTASVALTPTAVVPANIVGTPPDPLATTWIASTSRQCEFPRSAVQTTFGKTLRYADPAGVVYTDPRLFYDVVDRPGQTPLLITCPLSDTLAVIDPLTDRRIELDLPNSTYIDQMALSPNGRLLAMVVYPSHGEIPADWAPYQMLDLETGVTTRVLVEESFAARLIGWAGGKLYLHEQYSGTATFWEVDPAEQSPQPRNILTLGHSGGWALLPQNQALISAYAGQQPTWLDLQTGQSVPFTASTGLESPDGSMLALYLGGKTQIYDVQSQEFRLAQAVFNPSFRNLKNNDFLFFIWRLDSQELLIAQKTKFGMLTEVAIVRRDGTVRASALQTSALDERAGLPIFTSDGNLHLMINQGGQTLLRRIDTHATPFAISDLALPELGAIVYVPNQ